MEKFADTHLMIKPLKGGKVSFIVESASKKQEMLFHLISNLFELSTWNSYSNWLLFALWYVFIESLKQVLTHKKKSLKNARETLSVID